MKNFSVNCNALILIIACIFMAGCESNDNPVDSDDNNKSTKYIARESFSHTVPFNKHTQFRIVGVNGEISINGVTNSDTFVITGEKSVGSDSTEDAQEHLQYLDVTVQDLTHEVYVFTTQPQQSLGRNYTVDYTISMPKDLSVTVFTINGDVSVVSIDNSVTAENITGTIKVKDIVGDVSATLTNGRIEGDVTLPMNGTIFMRLVSGDIVLTIPKSTSASLTAQVTNGTIKTSGLDIKNQNQSQRSLYGTLGNGQGTLSLITINGSINISGQ